MTEDRGQMTEVRSQMTEVRSQRSAATAFVVVLVPYKTLIHEHEKKRSRINLQSMQTVRRTLSSGHLL
jgi:hypothetical protein